MFLPLQSQGRFKGVSHHVKDINVVTKEHKETMMSKNLMLITDNRLERAEAHITGGGGA